MNNWYDARTDEYVEYDAPVPELWESDNPVVGVLFDPSGGVLIEVRERPVVPFGFQQRPANA